MKKWILISLLTVAVLGVAAFAWSGTVIARSLYDNDRPFGYGMMGYYGYGHGMMRGYGYSMMGYGYDSAMHEYMIEELADTLGLTSDEINERIQAGETPWQIALAEGLTEEQIRELMENVHDQALQAAVNVGELTQEQADWMDEHMEYMWSGEYRGFGPCHGSNDWNNSEDSSFWNRSNPMMGGRWGNSF